MNVNELSVLQNQPTRWNATYAMLERLLIIHEPLNLCLKKMKFGQYLKIFS